MKSKTIILSNEQTDGRGILTITDEGDILKCKLRLYNVEKLSPACRLGIYHNNQVYTANLINRGSSYESSFAGNFDMSADFYSAIIDTANDNQVLLAGGTYAGYFFNDSTVFSNENADIEPAITSADTTTAQNDDQCDDCERCAHCKYKEYFYSTNNLEQINEPKVENLTANGLTTNTSASNLVTDNTAPITSPNTPTSKPNIAEQINTPKYNILDNIIPQFQYIFDNYEPNVELNSLIKSSRFVTIKDDNDEYSIGAIYEADTIAYICYAVRCNYNTPAPEELGKYHQWLPINADDPLSEGYHIVYQDAHDLKIVEV